MPIFVLFLLAGFVEISILILVGQAIGALPTIGLLFLGAVGGTWLLRREGRRTVREFAEAARLRRPPERGLGDGVMIAAGGILIILPGFVSDLAGLLCLFPPTRALLRRRLQRAAERRAHKMEQEMRERAQYVQGGSVSGPSPAAGAARPGTEDVIDGEVVSVSDDDEQQPKPDPPRKLAPEESTQAETSREQWRR